MTDPERNEEPPVQIEAFRAEMRAAGIEEVADEAIAAFMEETPDRMDGVGAALAQGDAATAGKLGHAIKSAAGGIRAVRLAELAAAMEQAGKGGDLDQARQLAPELQREGEAVFRFLTDATKN